MTKFLSLGVDLVEIDRFKHWHKYKKSSLSKIYSKQEIKYCLSNPIKSAERFAARFAIREALFKALSQYFTSQINFLSFCKLISIITKPNPEVVFSKKTYSLISLKELNSTISWSHSKTHAYATAIIY